MNTLQFLLPNLNRKMLIYWDTAIRKCNIIDTEKVFEGDDNNKDNNDDDDDSQNSTTLTRPTAHKLSVDDEYLLILMKLKWTYQSLILEKGFVFLIAQ